MIKNMIRKSFELSIYLDLIYFTHWIDKKVIKFWKIKIYFSSSLKLNKEKKMKKGKKLLNQFVFYNLYFPKGIRSNKPSTFPTRYETSA